jgi:hypothetical protein
MTIKLSSTLRAARATLIKNAIDADTNPGKLLIYTGTMPATRGGAITTQTLLGTLTLSKPCGTTDEDGTVFDTITDDTAADANGTIGFCRMLDGADTFVLDGDAGISGSGAMFIFNSLTVTAGGTLRCTAITLAEGG